jgi:hypothetical protein
MPNTPSVSNYNLFDFLTVSLTARLIQKIYATIIKFKSFLKNFLLIKEPFGWNYKPAEKYCWLIFL